MQEIERFTKQRHPVAGGRGLRPRGRRAGRAHRHGPPDALGRRGPPPSREVHERGGQGGAQRDDAAHPREQGKVRRLPAAAATAATANARNGNGNGAASAAKASGARQRQRQWQRPARARSSRNGTSAGASAAWPPQRQNGQNGRTCKTASAEAARSGRRSATRSASRARARTIAAAPSSSGSPCKGAPMDSPIRSAPASTAWPGTAGAAAAAAVAGRTALVAGATGLVGREILQGLLADESVAAVHVLARRPLASQHAKLTAHVVDFAALRRPAPGRRSLPGSRHHHQGGREPVCFPGRRFRCQPGGRLRRAGRPAPAASALVSAMGADARSSIFYNRVKGELEEALSRPGLRRAGDRAPFDAGGRPSGAGPAGAQRRAAGAEGEPLAAAADSRRLPLDRGARRRRRAAARSADGGGEEGRWRVAAQMQRAT